MTDGFINLPGVKDKKLLFGVMRLTAAIVLVSRS